MVPAAVRNMPQEANRRECVIIDHPARRSLKRQRADLQLQQSSNSISNSHNKKNGKQQAPAGSSKRKLKKRKKNNGKSSDDTTTIATGAVAAGSKEDEKILCTACGTLRKRIGWMKKHVDQCVPYTTECVDGSIPHRISVFQSAKEAKQFKQLLESMKNDQNKQNYIDTLNTLPANTVLSSREIERKKTDTPTAPPSSGAHSLAPTSWMDPVVVKTENFISSLSTMLESSDFSSHTS